MRRHFGFLSLVTLGVAAAQSPFDVAGDHYQRVFENDWVQVTRVVYGPYGKALLHDHPDRPTIYVYTTDGGSIRFSHADGRVIERKPVKAGGIRLSAGGAEKHSVESLSAIPSEYLRIEIKAEPFDRPERDVRLDPESHAPNTAVNKVQFESRQLRIVRVAGHAVARTYKPGEVVWAPGETRPEDAMNLEDQPIEQVRVELKLSPISSAGPGAFRPSCKPRAAISDM